MLTGIRNIIFDLGGVILDINIEKTKQAFRDIGFSEIDQLFGLGHAASYFLDHETGALSDEDFINRISTSIGGKQPDAVINAWNAMLLQFPEERINKLMELGKKYRLFLFSNTNGIHYEAFTSLYSASFGGGRLDDLFEKAYYSHRMKMRKPDKAAFEYILEANRLVAAETLFVDDAKINIEGAAQAGLKTFHITGDTTILDLELP